MLQELSIPTRYEDDRGDDSDVAARYLVITFQCNIAFHFVYSKTPDASKSRSFQQSSTYTLLFTPVHPPSLCITSLNIEMDEETEYAHTAYSTSMSLWNHSMYTPFHFNLLTHRGTSIHQTDERSRNGRAAGYFPRLSEFTHRLRLHRLCDGRRCD